MPERNLVDQKFSETDQKFPETGQLFFWATKKNEKKTGQLVHQETDQNHMDGTLLKTSMKSSLVREPHGPCSVGKADLT